MIKETLENLNKNNMNAFFVQNKKEALEKILEMIPSGSSVGFGGSVTIGELGAYEKLKEKNCKLYDHKYAKTPEEKKEVRKNANNSQYYLCSSNAITKDGKLVNIDGTGNRVSAITFGPENVIIVAGKNKIVEDEEKGLERIKNESAGNRHWYNRNKGHCIFRRRKNPCPGISGI